MPDPDRIEHPEKIGLGGQAVYGYQRLLSDLQSVNASWYYTWLPTPVRDQDAPLYDDISLPEFVPMLWSDYFVEQTYLSQAAQSLSNTLLAFNEPDHIYQSNMSVQTALDLWPELMDTGLRLGSPATTHYQALGESSWLGRFMDGVEDEGYHVDFIAVHYYTTNQNVSAFENFLTDLYDAYDLPIWVTEWALVDWYDLDRFTLDDTAQFFYNATQMLDDLAFVERHAWFSMYDGLDDYSINTHVFYEDGSLTPIGAYFQELTSTPEERVIMEFGSVVADHNYITVELEHTFIDPVVFLTMTSFVGIYPAVPRITEIEGNQFTFFAQEANYLDGIHYPETFSYFVLERGSWQLSDGTRLEIGTIDTNKLSSQGFEEVLFSTEFDTAPVIMSQVQTYNDGDFVTTRQMNSTAEGFRISMQEEELLNSGSHLTETLGYFAIQQGSGSSNGYDFVARQTGQEYTHEWHDIVFDDHLDELPQLLASISSYRGINPAILRADDLTQDGIRVHLQEDQSLDKEIIHIPETIDFFAIEGAGQITGTEII